MEANDRLLKLMSFSAGAFLRASDWQDVVESVLAETGRTLAVTRVHLFRTLEIRGTFVRSRLAYEWAVSPEWSEADSPDLRDFTHEEFAIPAEPPPSETRIIELRVADMPAEVRPRWERRGIVTSLATPLFVAGERWGAIGFDHCGSERTWTELEHLVLQGIADLLGSAIERNRAEEALRESEARLGFALESSGQGLWDWHIPTGRVLFNALWGEMLGYQQKELVPHVSQWEQLLHPDDRASVNATLMSCLSGRLPVYATEQRLRHKDGTWRWIYDRGRVVEWNSEGQPIRMVGTHTDITDRKEAERLRVDQEEQLRVLQRAVEQSPAAIVITDPAGTIVYVNVRFTEVTGYSREEVLGATPRIVNSGMQPQGFYRDLWQTILAGREWHGEIQNRRKDGSLFWEHMSISPVLDGSGRVTHFVAVKEDITAQRLLEEQLRHSQKMEAFGQVAGGVAHDFNNMLTAISGFASLLETEVRPDGEGESYLREVQHAATRSAELTRQLLAFSRKQILNPVTLDLNELVRRFQQMLKRVLGEDVLLVTELRPTPLPVRADPGQLEQVLLNLVVNARDAMPDGGRLTIITSRVTQSPDGGEWAELSIMDSGVGIRKENLDRIFEPFYTTKPVGRGTGLGLSTVYGIVTQSGGRIAVQSEYGRGTTFRVSLPLVLEAEQAVRPAEADPLAQRPGRGTILVVEDETAVRTLAVSILRRAGYHTLAASNGAEALTLLERTSEPVHLVLTDVVMPVIGGRELSMLLRARLPDLPILFMSGHTEDRVLRHGVEQHDMAFIAKPFTPDSLLRRVAELLAGAPLPDA